jgi:hypothetical protein
MNGSQLAWILNVYVGFRKHPSEGYQTEPKVGSDGYYKDYNIGNDINLPRINNQRLDITDKNDKICYIFQVIYSNSSTQ